MPYIYYKQYKSYYYYKNKCELCDDDLIILELMDKYEDKIEFLKKKMLVEKLKHMILKH